MRTRNFFYNSISAAVLQVVNMLVGLLMTRTILSGFGSEINGLVASLTQFVAYFSLVEAGISESVVFSLYKPLSEKNYEKTSGIIVAAKKYFNKTGIAFLGLVAILSLLYPVFVATHLLSAIEVRLLTFIIGMSGTIDFFIMAKYRSLLTADQKMYVLSFATMLSSIANLLIVIFCTTHGYSIVIVRLVALSSILLRSFILYLYVRLKYVYLNQHAVPDHSALSKRWNAFYLQILGVVQSGAPIILATVFTNLKTVSIYSIYMLIISGIRSILGIFESGLPATFGEVIAKNESATLQKAANEFECLYYALLALFYTAAVFLILPFISLYTKGIVDAEYSNSLLAALFILDGFFYNMKTPQGMLVLSAGLYKETQKQATLQAAIIIVVGLLLAPIWGIYGIVVGSICSNLYRTIDLLFFIPKHVTFRSVTVTFLRQLRAIIFLAIGMTVANMYRFQFIVDYGRWVVFAIAVLALLSICMVLILIVFDRSAFKALLLRIRKLLWQKK